MGEGYLIPKELFQPLADVCNNLINKFSEVAGWVMEPKGKRKDFEDAIESYKASIESDTNLSPLMKSALISKARKTLKEYCNINDILTIAMKQVNESAQPDQIDDDWVSYFYDHAKNVNRDDAKILWGKILSEECDNPGTISKQLIHTLSIMCNRQAETFSKLLSFCAIIQSENGHGESELKPMVYDIGAISDDMMTYDELADLTAVGLIEYSSITEYGHVFEEGNTTAKLIYGNKEIEIENTSSVNTGHVVFTPVGSELSKLIQSDVIEGYFEIIKKNFKSYK